MWLKLKHHSKGPILLNSDHVLYLRDVPDGRGGNNCEVYISYQDFILVDETSSEIEKQMVELGTQLAERTATQDGGTHGTQEPDS